MHGFLIMHTRPRLFATLSRLQLDQNIGGCSGMRRRRPCPLSWSWDVQSFYNPDSSKLFHHSVAEHATMLRGTCCCVCDHHGSLGHTVWESCPASTVHTSNFFDHNCSLDWLHIILSAPDLTIVYCHSINPTECLVLHAESKPQNCLVFPKKYLQSLQWLVCWSFAMQAVSHSSWVVHAITRTQDWLLVMLSFHPLLTMKHQDTSKHLF